MWWFNHYSVEYSKKKKGYVFKPNLQLNCISQTSCDDLCVTLDTIKIYRFTVNMFYGKKNCVYSVTCAAVTSIIGLFHRFILNVSLLFTVAFIDI